MSRSRNRRPPGTLGRTHSEHRPRTERPCKSDRTPRTSAPSRYGLIAERMPCSPPEASMSSIESIMDEIPGAATITKSGHAKYFPFKCSPDSRHRSIMLLMTSRVTNVALHLVSSGSVISASTLSTLKASSPSPKIKVTSNAGVATVWNVRSAIKLYQSRYHTTLV